MRTPAGASLEALSELYRAHFVRFLHVASAITGSEESGGDAVQDAFASAVRNRRRYRGEGSLEAWVWRMVVNASRKHAARSSRLAPGEPAVESVAGNGRVVENAGVRALVAALPERQRLVLFLRYYADLDYQAIADALEIAPGTVASTLNAAHATLRPLLQEVPT
jgi:RNA polymerase sigma factor (sigma-70 family)